MKKLKLNKCEQMLFALLRAALHERDAEVSFFQCSSEEEWKRCYRLAACQGVRALAWDGLLRLPTELRPPCSVKLVWAADVERYEKKYLRYVEAVDGLSRFYARHGISVLQLKGVGFSALYPVPSHREGGDIDLYAYSADPNRMSDGEANRLADDLMRRQGVDVDTEHSPKHSLFYYQGIPVENHKTFLNVEDSEAAVEAEKILRAHLNPRLTTLAGGQVLTPSPAFNALFIAFHAAQHYGDGLALHHLCDWACLSERHGSCLPEGMTDRRFLRFFSALTLLSNRLLGTEIPVAGEAPEALAQAIMKEILRPRYGKEVPAKSRMGILLYKTRRFGHRLRIRRKVLGESPYRKIFRSVVSHIREPETIFSRKPL